MDDGEAQTTIAALDAELTDLGHKRETATIDVNINGADSGLAGLESEVAGLDRGLSGLGNTSTTTGSKF